MEGLYETFEEPVNFPLESDHAINSYGFTQHESPELQAALACKGNPEDWTILLAVKSRGDFQWGDAGDLFFVIHKPCKKRLPQSICNPGEQLNYLML